MFDYENTILQYLISRRNDDSNVIGYTRSFQLIFFYLCYNDVFENDELLSVFKIVDEAIKDHVNRDKKNSFSCPAFAPAKVSIFYRVKCLLSIE